MNKNAHRVQGGYGFLALLLAVVMLFLGVLIGSARLASVEAKEAVVNREKCYTSIIVEDGDTLWDIADEYMSDEYKDKEDFISEVCSMNHLTGSLIRSGDILLVPYYITME